MTRVAVAFLVLCGVVALISAARDRSEVVLPPETLSGEGAQTLALPAGSGARE